MISQHESFCFFCSLYPYRNKLETLKNIENELRTVRLQLTEKEDQLISVQKSLDQERDEKMAIIEEKYRDDEQLLHEKNLWEIKKQELKNQLEKLTEATNDNRNIKFKETVDMDQAYQKIIKERDLIEIENSVLKSENKRLQMIIASPNEMEHLKRSANLNDDDNGYSSSRNTLEKHQKHTSLASSQMSEGDFYSMQHSNIQNNHSTTSTLERKLKSFFGFSKSGGNHRFVFL